MSETYTAEQLAAKEQFCRERGAWKWNDTWETILALKPGLLSAYSKLSSLPHRKNVLSQKLIGMIYVAIDGACTHMHASGMENHIYHGLEALGITPAEFLEVMAISSLLGAASYSEGLSELRSVFGKSGLLPDCDAPLTEAQEQLKKRFTEENGYWNDDLSLMLRLDPEMLDCYADYLHASFSGGVLDPKTRSLIFLAVNAAPSAVNHSDMRRHIEGALKAGASKEEILAVFELVCCQGIHTVMLGVPALNRSMEKLGIRPV